MCGVQYRSVGLYGWDSHNPKHKSCGPIVFLHSLKSLENGRSETGIILGSASVAGLNLSCSDNYNFPVFLSTFVG